MRFTSAKERGVVWKTYLVLSWWTGGVDVDGTGGYDTCEVTVKGPNLIRELGKGGIVVVCSG